MSLQRTHKEECFFSAGVIFHLPGQQQATQYIHTGMHIQKPPKCMVQPLKCMNNPLHMVPSVQPKVHKDRKEHRRHCSHYSMAFCNFFFLRRHTYHALRIIGEIALILTLKNKGKTPPSYLKCVIFNVQRTFCSARTHLWHLIPSGLEVKMLKQ